jgi:two-component system cell cycle response regulator DivK
MDNPNQIEIRAPGVKCSMPTVMLVEDNEANLNMLSRRLVRRGWAVVGAADGRKGLEMAVAELPDLILMDMSLPEIDGWELTRLLKGMELTKGIPVIALTAHAMQEDMQKALDAGCDEFETKPVDLNRLLKKMADLVNRRSSVKRKAVAPMLNEKVGQP